MTCDRCTRAPVGECVGEAFCAAIHLSDEDACDLAADACLAWWKQKEEEFELDDLFWEMAEQRINELGNDPEKARAYLATMQIE